MTKTLNEINIQQIKLIEKKLTELYSQLKPGKSGKIVPSTEIKHQQIGLIFNYGVKFCSVCKQVKLITNFYGNGENLHYGVGGYSTYCMDCFKKIERKRHCQTGANNNPKSKPEPKPEEKSVIYQCKEDHNIKIVITGDRFPEYIGVNPKLVKSGNLIRSVWVVDNTGAISDYKFVLFEKDQELPELQNIFKRAEKNENHR